MLFIHGFMPSYQTITSFSLTDTGNANPISFSLSNDNLTTEIYGLDTDMNTRARFYKSTGKYYWEITINTITSAGFDTIGMGNANITMGVYVGSSADGVGCIGNGGASSTRVNGLSIGVNDAWTTNDVVGIAIDIGGQLIWQRVNAGNWNSSAPANPATGVGGNSFATINAGPYVPVVGQHFRTDKVTANFGKTAFAQTPPVGFLKWTK